MKDVWKWISSLTGSIIITGLLAWWSFGGGVSRAEGEELKAIDSAILQRLAVSEEQYKAQQATLNELKRDVKEGNTATQGKLDAILLALPRDSDPRPRLNPARSR